MEVVNGRGESCYAIIVISLPGGWSFYTFVSTPISKTTPQGGIYNLLASYRQHHSREWATFIDVV